MLLIIGIVIFSIGCKYFYQDDTQYLNEVIKWLSIVGVFSMLRNGKTLLKIISLSLNKKLTHVHVSSSFIPKPLHCIAAQICPQA